jgi:hypothetical protein
LLSGWSYTTNPTEGNSGHVFPSVHILANRSLRTAYTERVSNPMGSFNLLPGKVPFTMYRPKFRQRHRIDAICLNLQLTTGKQCK